MKSKDFKELQTLRKIVIVAAMRHRQSLTETRSMSVFFAGELEKYMGIEIDSITTTQSGSIQVVTSHPGVKNKCK